MHPTLVIFLFAIFGASQGVPARNLDVFYKRFPHRIIGGDPAEPNEFPHLLSIAWNGNHICGGSVLTGKWLLTAAHCAELGPPSQYQIRGGVHALLPIEDTWQIRSVSRIIIHADYSSTTLVNDIALMEVSEAFEMNLHVQPIAIPTPFHTASGEATLSGWGSTREGGPVNTALLKVKIPIVDDETCRIAYQGSNEVADHMICSGFAAGGHDSCQGDSGGPVLAEDTGVTYQCGIVSWAIGCARPGYYGVNTEVSHFIDWIIENVQ